MLRKLTHLDLVWASSRWQLIGDGEKHDGSPLRRTLGEPQPRLQGSSSAGPKPPPESWEQIRRRVRERMCVCVYVFTILHKKGPHALLHKDMQAGQKVSGKRREGGGGRGGTGEGEGWILSHTVKHTRTHTDGVQQRSWCKSSRLHKKPVNLESRAEVHSQFNRWLGCMGHEIWLSALIQFSLSTQLGAITLRRLVLFCR